MISNYSLLDVKYAWFDAIVVHKFSSCSLENEIYFHLLKILTIFLEIMFCKVQLCFDLNDTNISKHQTESFIRRTKCWYPDHFSLHGSPVSCSMSIFFKNPPTIKQNVGTAFGNCLMIRLFQLQCTRGGWVFKIGQKFAYVVIE